jgi:membrane-associated phospholipid phosphatase
MTVRQLLIAAAASAVLTVLAIFTIDAPIARALADVAKDDPVLRVFDRALELLDTVTGMNLKRGQLPALLIVLGGALWFWRRAVGRPLLLLGLTHAVSRVGGSYLKPVFGRLRPREALEAGHVDDSFWWPDGLAFPSGHIGHYAALAFGAAVLWPRARIPAFAVLAVVAVARIGRDAHFVSDVTGAMCLAALAAAAFDRMLPRAS